jgi:hypothetical protein
LSAASLVHDAYAGQVLDGHADGLEQDSAVLGNRGGIRTGKNLADLTPAEARASAYGVYHTAIGITALPASLLTGWLWQWLGAGVAFGTGAALAAAAAVLLWALLRGSGRSS